MDWPPVYVTAEGAAFRSLRATHNHLTLRLNTALESRPLWAKDGETPSVQVGSVN